MVDVSGSSAVLDWTRFGFERGRGCDMLPRWNIPIV